MDPQLGDMFIRGMIFGLFFAIITGFIFYRLGKLCGRDEIREGKVK